MPDDATVDVLVIGGGPAGSTVAMRLCELGVKPLIVERERFPRFHIGESMNGECGGLIRALGLEQRMIDAGHPQKQGVVTYGRRGTPDWFLPVLMRTPDAELHEQYTWQVRRSDFDSMMLDEALSRGAELLAGRATQPLVADDGRTVRGARVELDDGSEIDVAADLTLDCTGQATFFANRHVTGAKFLGSYDKQIAIFGHTPGFVRDAGGSREAHPDNTSIFYQQKFHWAWAIPIDDEIVSVGVVVPAATFRAARTSKTEFLLQQMRQLNPGLSAHIDDTTLVEPAHVIPNYSFQARRFTGPGFICVGDAHRFVDPIFSFGLYLTMKEAFLVAPLAMAWLAGEQRDSADPFAAHRVVCERAIDILEDTIDLFWENPIAFSVFAYDRYRTPLVDIFAGRIYGDLPNDDVEGVMRSFRRLLGRERSYGPDDDYSVPIGSRYHPERAPLWNSVLDDVATTERWMRDELTCREEGPRR